MRRTADGSVAEAPSPSPQHADPLELMRADRLIAVLRIDHPAWVTRLLFVIFTIVLGIVLVEFAITWNQPLLELHSFRQTQTALTAFWLMHGSPLLAYETPVLGYPWSIPFEFPLFQMLAAATAKSTGLPLDNAGRLTAFLFYLATVWTLFELRRQLQLPVGYALTAASLYLLSPLYRFWGRSFMIESCALFLGFVYLLLIVAGRMAGERRRERQLFLAAALVGSLAGAVKVTTFAVFLLAALLLLLFSLPGRRVASRSAPTAQPAAMLFWLSALLIPIGAVELWTGFADSQKALNPIGLGLISSEMNGWNFGPIALRFDKYLWLGVIGTRSIAEALGRWSALFLTAAVVLFIRGRALALVLCLIVLFLSAFLVFPNLHLVHNYYQYANSVFLILAGATCIWVAGRRKPAVLLGLLCTVLVLQETTFRDNYARVMFGRLDDAAHTTLSVSSVLRTRTQPEDVVLVFGYEWSSEIAYYSQRRAITVPDWETLQVDVLANLDRHLGPHRLGAIVVCPNTRIDARFEQVLRQTAVGMTHDTSTECRIFLRRNV